MFLLVDIIYLSVDGEDRNGVDALQPLLMAFVYLPQIVQPDALLALSSSLLYALQAELRRTFQINDSLEWAFTDDCPTDLIVNGILRRIQVSLAVHDLSEDIAIGKWGSFRVMQPIGLLGADLLPEHVSGVYGVELEGEGPPLGVLIVILEDIDAAEVLPLVNGLLDEGDVEEREERGFACPQVALDGDYSRHVLTITAKNEFNSGHSLI